MTDKELALKAVEEVMRAEGWSAGEIFRAHKTWERFDELYQRERKRIAEAREIAQAIDPEPAATEPAPDCGGAIRQEGDEYVCIRCALRWDTHEDQPPCPYKR